MGQYKIIATGDINPSALERIKPHCEIRVWSEQSPVDSNTLQKWLSDAEGLFNSGFIRIDDNLLAQTPKLRVISQPSAGYDNVDVAACTAHGIPLGNTSKALAETTADLAFALLLTSVRRITQGWDMVREGRWLPNADIPFGIDLYGKTLGIVGMGTIGSALARRAQACGMNIIYHNRKPRPECIPGAKWAAFDQLLAESDCIVVLAPLTQETKGLFNAEAFAEMKPSAHFINAARGPIVKTQDLYDALANHQIAFAALDVTDPEPLPADHPLLRLPNILITPHVGSATRETRARMALLAADNLLAGLRREKLPSCVNSEVNFS